MKNKLFLLLLSTVVGLSAVFAAAGKIRGRVLDDKTKEAIIGASVTIVGTNYGAATDVDGNFIVLNVPTGTYTVRASLLGYGPVAISNIKVSEDLSSEVNFNLTSSEVQLGEVLITQDRPLINKNATNAVRIGTQDDIQKLPIRGVTAAVVLSPGVVQQNGNLYIRGSRADEVGYYLEGASTRNIRDGQNLTTVIPEALEEFQLQAGGFTAEYGGANAGIVRQSLRTGGQDYKVMLQAETDNFTSQYTKKLGTYSYGFSNYVVTVGGPVPGMKNVKFFVAGENEFQRDNQQRFWEGFTMTNLPNSSIPGDTVRILEIKPGNIPGGMRNRFITNGTLVFDFNPFVVRLGGSFSHQRSQNSTDPLGDYFDLARIGIVENSNALINAKLTHILNKTTSYDVNISYTDDRNKTFDPDHGDDFLKYNDSIANSKFGYRYRNYTSGPLTVDLYGFGTPSDGNAINGFGQAQTGFAKNKQNRIGASLDIISQVNSQHQLKIGASVEQYTVRRYTLNGTSSLLNYFRTTPDEARTPSLNRDLAVGRNGGVNNYGYDWYGKEIEDADNIDGPKNPQYIAAYIQDKIEYSDLIINAGIRLDYIDNDDFKFVDDPTTPTVVEGPDYPSIDLTDASYKIYKASGIAKSEAFVQISPRLGFSFPVSERTVFFLQYGKYIQSPQLNNLYSGRGNQATIFNGGNFIPTPVGFDLSPIRNTSYEVGFRQQIAENASIELNGFYKDIQGQIQIQRNTVRNGSSAQAYNTFVNGDFVTTKGLEFSLTLRRVNRITAKFNYTFSDAQGTGSTINSAVSSVESGTLNPTVISPLDFNNTHRGAINVDYSFGKDDGGPILEQLGTNLLFTFSSGHPFTRSTGSIGQQGVYTGALVENDARFSNPLESINASTTPWNFNFDMRLYKTVGIAGFQTEIYVYVQNLLNTKNVLNVYRRTGNAFDDGYLSNPELSQNAIDARGQGFVDLYTYANLVNGRHYRNVTGNNLFGTPRQIRFGMRVDI